MPDSKPENYRIFVSYSRHNLDVASQLSRKLEDAGVEVWIDKKQLILGNNWRRQVDRALKSSDYMLYLHSFDAEASDEVWYEWGYFLQTKKTIIPVILDNTELPYPFVSVQHITFSEKQFDKTIQKILAALGITVPVPPDDPNDPGNGDRQVPREHTEENQEHNYVYATASSGDQNGDTRLFHLFIVSIRQSVQIDFKQSRDNRQFTPVDDKLKDNSSRDISRKIKQHDNLDDSIRKQVEEIVERVYRKGVAIRPSDLKDMEFEIIEWDSNSNSDDDEHSQSDIRLHNLSISEPDYSPYNICDIEGICDTSTVSDGLDTQFEYPVPFLPYPD